MRKPLLTAEILSAGGFDVSAHWVLDETGDLGLDQPLPRVRGVYAFVREGAALYVGVAMSGLATRLRFYMKPGPRQQTSIRVKAKLLLELASIPTIHIYTASPEDLTWNGLPVSGSAGLEVGLIAAYSLAWNIRGSG
ncbi:MAG TPA: hypothetical protein VF559_03295 [Caulobacteraceae bacterium]|jgi:hypothetical protein